MGKDFVLDAMELSEGDPIVAGICVAIVNRARNADDLDKLKAMAIRGREIKTMYESVGMELDRFIMLIRETYSHRAKEVLGGKHKEKHSGDGVPLPHASRKGR